MTRNLKTLGLALVAALALSAFAASAASAEPATFTCAVTGAEKCELHSEQVGANTFTINGLSLTCATATATGFPEFNDVHVPPPSTYLTLTPNFGGCHVNVLFVTRTVTVTHNGCYYTFNATKNTTKPWWADLHVKCPANKSIEVHVYNTSNANDTGAAVLCTYDVTPQTILNQIELTNIAGTPDDVLAHINANVSTDNTIKSGTCGNNATENAVYSGTQTIRGTSDAGAFVNTTIS